MSQVFLRLVCGACALVAASLAEAVDDLGPFGIGSCHVNNRSVDDNQRWVPQMAEIGLRFYRTPQTAWSAVEPQ